MFRDVVLTFISLYFSGDGQKPEKGPFLPYEIHNLYETSLLNLVGCEKIPKELCGDELNKKIRLKFNNAISHSKTRSKVS